MNAFLKVLAVCATALLFSAATAVAQDAPGRSAEAKESRAAQKTVLIRPEHVRVAELRAPVQNLLSGDSAYLHVDSREDVLVVSDRPEAIAKIEKLVRELDVPAAENDQERPRQGRQTDNRGAQQILTDAFTVDSNNEGPAARRAREARERDRQQQRAQPAATEGKALLVEGLSDAEYAALLRYLRGDLRTDSSTYTFEAVD